MCSVSDLFEQAYRAFEECVQGFSLEQSVTQQGYVDELLDHILTGSV